MKLNLFGCVLTTLAMILISVVTFMMVGKYVALPETSSFVFSVFWGILSVFLPTLLGLKAKKEETRKYLLNQQFISSIAITVIFCLLAYNTFGKNVSTANSLQVLIPVLIGGILHKIIHKGLVKHEHDT